MKRLLSIDTSGEACSVALQSDNGLSERHEHAPLRHAELLMPAITALLQEAGLATRDLDAIVFGRGPGSFTSLRIGIGVVQGLAWGAELPVVPLSSLAVVAQQARALSGPGDHKVLVAMDARMNEVFCGEFRAGDDGIMSVVGAERVCPPDQLDSPGGDFIAAGNGFERFSELGALNGAAVQSYPDLWPCASVLLEMAGAWLERNDPLPAAMAQPVYIRNQVASKPAAA